MEQKQWPNLIQITRKFNFYVVDFKRYGFTIHYMRNMRNTTRNSVMLMLIHIALLQNAHNTFYFVSFAWKIHLQFSWFVGSILNDIPFFCPLLAAPLYLLLLPLLSTVGCRCPCGIAGVNL